LGSGRSKEAEGSPSLCCDYHPTQIAKEGKTMSEPDITLEGFTAVLKDAVRIYREEVAKLGEKKSRNDLLRCAENAADGWHLRSILQLGLARASRDEFVARHLQLSNEFMTDAIMAIARIEDEEKPEDAKQMIAGLIYCTLLDFRMRSSLGMFAR